jgi:hypothetical protein
MGKHNAPDENTADTAGATGAGTSGTAGTAEAPVARPALYIVKGNPTPEEIAALTVVLAAASQGGEEAEQQRLVGGWGDPGSTLRTPLRPGAGAWRMSVR